MEQVDLTGETMGTTYTVKVIGNRINREGMRRGIESELARINSEMSTWKEDSEISAFNRQQTAEWFGISAGFMTVLRAAWTISDKTEGAFDITVGKLVELWGFGVRARPQVPAAGMIAETLRHTGPSTYELDLANSAIRKTDIETKLDLSGIAKGYAVDVLADHVANAGVENFLVEIGGEVRVSGKRLDGTFWQVAIEKPVPTGRSAKFVFGLENAAIATSGDYRNFFEIQGKRYSHIIDPRTGHPPEHGLASVSVIASDAMTADALATAMMVMGAEEALSLADSDNIAVLLIEREGTVHRIHRSERFRILESGAAD